MLADTVGTAYKLRYQTSDTGTDIALYGMRTARLLRLLGRFAVGLMQPCKVAWKLTPPYTIQYFRYNH